MRFTTQSGHIRVQVQCSIDLHLLYFQPSVNQIMYTTRSPLGQSYPYEQGKKPPLSQGTITRATETPPKKTPQVTTFHPIISSYISMHALCLILKASEDMHIPKPNLVVKSSHLLKWGIPPRTHSQILNMELNIGFTLYFYNRVQSSNFTLVAYNSHSTLLLNIYV